jgi:hypothetical protein
MATDIVGSLFGVSPEMYQQQMNRQALQDAIAMQELTPLQRAGALIQSGTYMAGQGLGGAFGIEDPMLKMISTRNALAKQFDINSLEGLTGFAQALQQAGDVQGAAQASGLARQIQASMVEQAQKSAAAQKNIQDVRQSQLAEIDLNTEKDAVRAYLQSKNMPDSQINAIVSNKEARDSYLKKAQETTSVVEANGRVLLVNKADGSTIKDLGSAIDRAPKTTVDVNLPGLLQQIQLSTEAKEQGQLWAQAGERYKGQKAIIGDLQEFRRITPNAFTGTGAELFTNASKLLNAAGIPISEKASNTEILNALKSGFVQKIAKNFPGSQAIKELEQLLQSVANPSQLTPTIMRLVERGIDDALVETKTYEELAGMKASDRLNANGNLISGRIRDDIGFVRDVERRAANNQAGIEDTKKAIEIKKRLGI